MTSVDRDKRERDIRLWDETLRWLHDVTRYALSLMRNEADAEDLVQDTYLRVYAAWHQFAAGILHRRDHPMGLATLPQTPSRMGVLSELLERPPNEQAMLVLPGGIAPGARVPPIFRRKPLDAIAI